VPDAPGLELIRGEIEQDHPGAILDTGFDHGAASMSIDPAHVLAVLTWLRDAPGQGYRFLSSLHAADYLPAAPRFAVHYELLNRDRVERLRVKALLADPASSAGGADSGGPRTEAQPPPAGPPEVVTGPAGLGDVVLEDVTRVWPAVIDKLRETSPALAATFEGARPIEVDGAEKIVTIGFPAENTFNKRKAEAPEKREQMEVALESVVSEKLRPVYVVLEGEAPAAPAEEAPSSNEIDHDALVEKLKSEFDAEEVG